MEKEYFISMWLDKRRAKATGKYPVKLRVFTPSPRAQKLYNTEFEFTEKEFNSVWETVKPREEYKAMRNKMIALEAKAIDIAGKIVPFNIKRFEKLILRNKGEGVNITYHYNNIIALLTSEDRHGTASSYKLSLASLLKYASYLQKKEVNSLLFTEITPEWLRKYEYYMLSKLKRSRTTVGIYLRSLRAVYNVAINEKDITEDIYPFGGNQYQIPNVKKVKKALNKDTLNQLFKATPKTIEQEKAKDFWYFSYTCGGINPKDIALLKEENIKEDSVVFFRAKTINTKKRLSEISFPLTDFPKTIIEKYGNPNRTKKDFVFGVLSPFDSSYQQHWKIKNFTRFINQNLKKLAIDNGITGDISTYWARHSFSTNSIRSGASIELVGALLGHSDIKTTQSYFSGFENEDKKEIMERLMQF